MAIVNYVFEKIKVLYLLGVAIAAYVFYNLIRSNAKLKQANDNLESNLKETVTDAKKIITIQKKQNEIAARPADSWDDIERKLHELSQGEPEKHWLDDYQVITPFSQAQP